MTIARTGSSTSPAAASAASTASRRAVHTSASSELRVACRSRVTTATAPSLRLSIMAGSTSWLDAGVLPCTPRAEDTRCVWRPPYDAGMARTGALTMLDLVLDEGSFLSWDDAPLRSPDVDTAPGYATDPRLPDLRRHAEAGGHGRVPADGQDLRRGGRAQAGGAAVPGLPTPPHHRGRVRLVGVPRARLRGRAGRAHRIPRPPRVRGPV